MGRFRTVETANANVSAENDPCQFEFKRRNQEGKNMSLLYVRCELPDSLLFSRPDLDWGIGKRRFAEAPLRVTVSLAG